MQTIIPLQGLINACNQLKKDKKKLRFKNLPEINLLNFIEKVQQKQTNDVAVSSINMDDYAILSFDKNVILGGQRT